MDYIGMVEVFSGINRELNFRGDTLLAELKISKTEAIYLRIIWENPGITQYNIAKLKNCSKNLVIKHVSKLEEKGLVEKKQVDNMRKEILLTEKGNNTIELIFSSLKKTGKVMFEGYSEEEIKKFLEISLKIKKRLETSNMREHFKNKDSFKKYD